MLGAEVGSLYVALAEGWRHALADAPPEGVLSACGQHRRAGRACCTLHSTCMIVAELQCNSPAVLACRHAGLYCWDSNCESKTGSPRLLAMPCCVAGHPRPSAAQTCASFDSLSTQEMTVCCCLHRV